ncbi:MAG: helix-turn-helix transcriptional regulator [Bacillus sp. (in: Bacteria)]|jgi:transcriptional regulator with XRE-family HTH domain|nr:helix-turn-helix transcriptional regulator [Bacillus sp. (in: firmicutes)]
MRGDTIRKLRRLQELSQADLAKQIGISQSYLSYIESGKRTSSEEIIKKLIEEFYPSFKFID